MRFKSEPNDSGSTVFEGGKIEPNIDASTPLVKQTMIIHNRALAQQTNHQQEEHQNHDQEPPLRIVASHSGTHNVRRNEDIAATTGDGYYDEFEVEYVHQQPPPPKRAKMSEEIDDNKEIERIRKENLLIKNSVLKKKERLLELQIALAERSLRRQI